MFGSRIRDKDGVAATVSPPVIKPLLKFSLFPARVHGNGRFAAPIRADGAKVFRQALPDIRILPGEYVAATTGLNPEYLPDE